MNNQEITKIHILDSSIKLSSKSRLAMKQKSEEKDLTGKSENSCDV
jgi:hypothetical protein